MIWQRVSWLSNNKKKKNANGGRADPSKLIPRFYLFGSDIYIEILISSIIYKNRFDMVVELECETETILYDGWIDAKLSDWSIHLMVKNENKNVFLEGVSSKEVIRIFSKWACKSMEFWNFSGFDFITLFSCFNYFLS